MVSEKVKSGVSGFDNLISGGFPKSSVVLVTGDTGTGKSVFGMNYVHEGAKNGESCVYMTFEQSEESIKSNAKSIGLDFDKMEKEGKLKVIGINAGRPTQVLEKISRMDPKPTRLVVDSLTMMTSLLEDNEVRPDIYNFAFNLRKMGVTTLLITDIVEGEPGLSKDGYSEFLCDGVIKLEAAALGEELQRNIRVVKMRETTIDGGLHTLEIDDKGIRVK